MFLSSDNCSRCYSSYDWQWIRIFSSQCNGFLSLFRETWTVSNPYKAVTIYSMSRFRRAFSAAILGDVFNICGLFVIFPMEMLTGLIEKVSWWIVDPLISEQGLSFKTLELLTDPINQIILQVRLFSNLVSIEIFHRWTKLNSWTRRFVPKCLLQIIHSCRDAAFLTRRVFTTVS